MSKPIRQNFVLKLSFYAVFTVVSTYFSLQILNGSLVKSTSAGDRLTYDVGYYTNLYGSGLDADFHTGEYCTPQSGKCESKGSQHVEKFLCSGKKDVCEKNQIGSSNSKLSISPDSIPCNSTVQIDVWDKSCFDRDSYDCKVSDYIVWYKPSCEVTPTPSITVTPTPTVTSTPTPTPTPTVTSTPTPSVTVTPTVTPTPTSTPIITPTPTNGDMICKINIHDKEGDVPFTAKMDARQSTATDSNILTKFHWDFGDGHSADGLDVEHTYRDDGNFFITLTIEDTALKSAECKVEVNAKGDDEEEDNDDDDDDDDNDDSDGHILASSTRRVGPINAATGDNSLLMGLSLASIGASIKVFYNHIKSKSIANLFKK